MSFSLVPPEITSGMIYSGPGSASLAVASQAWGVLGQEVESAALAQSTVVNDILTTWHGPSSIAMVAAFQPFVLWMHNTSAVAEQMSTAAASTAAAFETVHASVVPPPEIAYNRTLLMFLVATNFLGQNTAAIAATEADYMRMWAQDSMAMATYSANSTAITSTLPAVTPAPNVTQNVTQQSSAAASSPAASPLTWIEQFIAGFSGASTKPGDPLLTQLGALLQSNGINSILSGDLLFGAPMGVIQGVAALAALSMASSAAGRLGTMPPGLGWKPPTTGASSPVPPAPSASAGQSLRIGGARLSVPPSWANAMPESTSATTAALLPVETAAAEELAVPLGMPLPFGALSQPTRASGEKKRNRWSEYDDLQYGENPGSVVVKQPGLG